MFDRLAAIPPSPQRLEAATWRTLLAALHDELACASAGEEVARLREAFVLFVRAPRCMALAALPEAERFAGWLGAGAVDTAALALVGQHGAYMLSRSGDGSHLATVVLAGQAQEHSAEGATLALALLGAICAALLDAGQVTGADVADGPSALLH